MLVIVSQGIMEAAGEGRGRVFYRIAEGGEAYFIGIWKKKMCIISEFKGEKCAFYRNMDFFLYFCSVKIGSITP